MSYRDYRYQEYKDITTLAEDQRSPNTEVTRKSGGATIAAGDHFIFRSKRRDKKCTEEYTKEQAERLSLETKLYELLPEIFKLPSPKGNAIGHRYKSLEKLRDRIIHMKSKDRRSSLPGEENVWKELLVKSSPNVAIEAKEIIGYYLDSLDEDNKPR